MTRPARTVTLVLLAGLLTGPALLAEPAAAAPAPVALERGAPQFLRASTARGAVPAAPRSVRGTSRLVTLDTSLLPSRAGGQRIGFDLGDRSVSGRFTRIEHNRAYTAWSGPLDVDLGSFTIVRSGSLVRAQLTSPQGVWTITRAEGEQYWLTAVAPYVGGAGEDAIPGRVRARDRAPVRLGADRAKRGRSKIDVLFAYTASAKLAAGGKAGVKAAAGQIAAETNLAYANSGIKATIKVKGVVRVGGQESANVIKDAQRLQRPHDGTFDAALTARARKHADIVHLLTGGPSDRLCGAGLIPRTPREAVPANGASTSYISCLPYLVGTHELGHNLGADHISYPGISHYSKMRGSYAWYDVAHSFITALSYYEPCTDTGNYTCVRIPYYSNPKGTYGGFALGAKNANNARVIKQLAPLVARYSR